MGIVLLAFCLILIGMTIIIIKVKPISCKSGYMTKINDDDAGDKLPMDEVCSKDVLR